MSVTDAVARLRKVLAAPHEINLQWLENGEPFVLNLTADLPPILDRLAALEAFAKAFVDAEWTSDRADDRMPFYQPALICYECNRTREEGHRPDCARGAAVAANALAAAEPVTARLAALEAFAEAFAGAEFGCDPESSVTRCGECGREDKHAADCARGAAVTALRATGGA